MSDFTPGPWLAAPYSSIVGAPIVASPSGRSIAKVTYFRLGEGFEKHDAQSAANARLIAAAPDLLEALQAIMPGKLCGESWNLPDYETVQITATFGRLKAARAAIAKALGKEEV